MRDTVNVLREGVPAVGLVHEPFVTLSRLAVAQVGMPDAPVLGYPRDLVSQETEEQLERKARMVAERAAAMLLSVGRGPDAEGARAPAPEGGAAGGPASDEEG